MPCKKFLSTLYKITGRHLPSRNSFLIIINSPVLSATDIHVYRYDELALVNTSKYIIYLLITIISAIHLIALAKSLAIATVFCYIM